MAGLTVPQAKTPAVLAPGEEERQLVRGYQAESAALPAALAPIQRERTQLEGEMRGISEGMPKPPQLQEVPHYQPRQLDSEDLAVQKQQPAQSLVLGGRGDLSVHGKGRQELAEFGRRPSRLGGACHERRCIA